VVASASSALPEVIGGAGLAAPGEGPGYADAILDLASRSPRSRWAMARRQAERYPWSAAVRGFLAAHDLAAHDLGPHGLAGHDLAAPFPAAGAR
jgi:alpha-1,6-mannosyltransferase